MTRILFFLKSILFALLISNSVFSINYNCPKVPFTAGMGEKTKGDWLVAPENDESLKPHTSINLKFNFKNWFETNITNFKDPEKSIISCCDSFDEKIVCLKKIVPQTCSTPMEIRRKNDFICHSNQLNTKK